MLRFATTGDLNQLAALYKELIKCHNIFDSEKYQIPDDEKCYAEMKNALESKNMFIICSQTDSQIDGYACFTMFSPEELDIKDGLLLLNEIFVTEAKRRLGIGTALLNEVISVGKEKQCQMLQISVNCKNYGAQKFYEKMGITPKTIHLEKRI